MSPRSQKKLNRYGSHHSTIPHEDFTVAWICALPVEMAAAEAMLDEKYEGLPTHPKFQNTYTLGRINSHNVVIVYLPLGVYSTISALIVASQIQHTFKSICYSLMVGIGGVPSINADIRLGDIVVSKPTRDFGGVIQYDYGKTISEGSLQRTGMLNKPPPILLTAVSKMQAQEMLGSDHIFSHLAKASVTNASLSDMFTYCGMEQYSVRLGIRPWVRLIILVF
ncbi:nucleoside phosphorylase [Talaromyces pinophilus]|uniref:Nucleoside phosphorylase n=1 Tax=Talaromyces pinophilus TaxID=128442 RepID=A0A698XPU7_TALPI|nr:nucleoside phosphorylase [Talaromyces pinophilus]